MSDLDVEAWKNFGNSLGKIEKLNETYLEVEV